MTGPGSLDRRSLARSLAQVHAFTDCGQEANAQAAAWTLAQQLRAAGLLPDRLDLDRPALDAIARHRLAG